jgi:DNA polymerase I-like protein with 3'-5' exonuclease and polymerase domains
MFTPKRTNGTSGYVEGAELQRLKDFNPSSRDHISWILQTHYGWKPTSITNSGKPVIDEIILKDIGTDISLSFLRILELTKALGMISEGKNAWQKLVTTSSRIHHHCSVSTATFRCAHRNPNLAQVPADERFRKLFKATPDHVLVGADLSGIELRMLAHYLARYDQGRYGDILVNGDIHQTNADKIGISRRQVKTVTYAFLYGAGNQRLGLAYDPQLSETKARKKGKEIREAYVAAIPGLKEFLEAVHKSSERGFLYGLDHRRIIVDSRHKSLNFLLQGSAAIIAKKWMVLAHEKRPKSSHQLAFIHDELQYECHPSDAEELKQTLEESAKAAGESYELRLPIAATAKSGETWADVH